MIQLKPSDRFNRADGRKYISAAQETFLTHFKGFGCTEVPSVAITSGIDPTVRFIGSHISVLKPYLTEEKILPEKGVVILQDCVRTRNVKRLGERDFNPKWGSFFPSLGALVPYAHLQGVSEHMLSFFHDKLSCGKDDIVLRVNNADADLTQVCQAIIAPENIEYDAMPLTYYRHKIGMDNVKGRNFNMAFKDQKTGALEDVGNVIVLEKDGLPQSVEIAIGSTTTLKQIYSLDHILDCHSLILPETQLVEPGLKRQLEDTIITSTALVREGLIPSNKDNRSRLLKTYVDTLNEISATFGMDRYALVDAIDRYEETHYSNVTGASIKLVKA